MIKQAGVIAWLAGIAALVALTVWSGLDQVGHAIASIGWGILLVVVVRAGTGFRGGGRLVAALPAQGAPAVWSLSALEVHSRGGQRPVAGGASRRRRGRCAIADRLWRPGGARGRKRHRRRPHPSCRTISICSARPAYADGAGSGSCAGAKRGDRDWRRGAVACRVLCRATAWRATRAS